MFFDPIGPMFLERESESLVYETKQENLSEALITNFDHCTECSPRLGLAAE